MQLHYSWDTSWTTRVLSSKPCRQILAWRSLFRSLFRPSLDYLNQRLLEWFRRWAQNFAQTHTYTCIMQWRFKRTILKSIVHTYILKWPDTHKFSALTWKMKSQNDKPEHQFLAALSSITFSLHAQAPLPHSCLPKFGHSQQNPHWGHFAGQFSHNFVFTDTQTGAKANQENQFLAIGLSLPLCMLSHGLSTCVTR